MSLYLNSYVEKAIDNYVSNLNEYRDAVSQSRLLDSRQAGRTGFARKTFNFLRARGWDLTGIDLADKVWEQTYDRYREAEKELRETILTTDGEYPVASGYRSPSLSYNDPEKPDSSPFFSIYMYINLPRIEGPFWVQTNLPALRTESGDKLGLRTHQDGMIDLIVPPRNIIHASYYSAGNVTQGIIPLQPNTSYSMIEALQVQEWLKTSKSVQGIFAKDTLKF